MPESWGSQFLCKTIALCLQKWWLFVCLLQYIIGCDSIPSTDPVLPSVCLSVCRFEFGKSTLHYHYRQNKGGKCLSKTGTKDQGQCIHHSITTHKAREENALARQAPRTKGNAYITLSLQTKQRRKILKQDRHQGPRAMHTLHYHFRQSKEGKFLSKTGTKGQGKCIYYYYR